MNAKVFLLRFSVWAAGGLLIFLGFRFLLPCLLPFLFGGAIALFLHPLAQKLHHLTSLSWKPSAIVVTILFYGVFGVAVWGLGVVLFSQTSAFCQQLPHFYQSTLEPMARNLNTRFTDFLSEISPATSQQVGIVAVHLGEIAQNTFSSLSAQMLSSIAAFAKALPSSALALSFTLLSSFFILIDYDMIAAFISRQIPSIWTHSVHDSQKFLLSTCKNVIKAYFLLMLITFAEVTIGLWMLKIEYFALLGLVVALLDALPILGSGSILVPWGLYLLAGGRYPLGAGILILYGVVTVARAILEPRILGSKIGLHPLATLLAMYAGMRLAGFWGLITAPVLVTLVVYLNRKERLQLFH